MHHLLKIFLLLALLAVGFGACRRDPDLTGIPEVSYNNDIKRIMSGNCAFPGCHDGGGGEAGGLVTYEEVMGQVKAGEARKSELYRIVTGRSFTKMPPSGYPDVSKEDIRLIYLWIEQGAKNN
jgi:hypothetical protein